MTRYLRRTWPLVPPPCCMNSFLLLSISFERSPVQFASFVFLSFVLFQAQKYLSVLNLMEWNRNHGSVRHIADTVDPFRSLIFKVKHGYYAPVVSLSESAPRLLGCPTAILLTRAQECIRSYIFTSRAFFYCIFCCCYWGTNPTKKLES